MTYQQLEQQIKNTHPDFDFSLLAKAHDFALIAHGQQKRLSGETVVEHALKVCKTLFDFRMVDASAMAASLLHHVLDDTPATVQDLQKEFSEEIVELVKTLTTLHVIKLSGSTDSQFVENLRKMFLAMAKDLRVVLIKLADIYRNLQTLQFLPPGSQQRVAKDVMEIFAPLAERLGMGDLKGKLEDLAFPFLYPQEYQWLQSFIKDRYQKLDKILIRVKNQVKLALEKERIAAEIQARAKHQYSLYQKLLRPEIAKDLSLVYDLVALRVVVDTMEQCYAVLGIIHQLFPPVAGHVRDYIAQPKPNGYRSIHTTVRGPADYLFEVQIRTWQMHEDAEYGVAAHWHYSENKAHATDQQAEKGFLIDEKRLAWVKQLTEWQSQVNDQKEFLESLKITLFADRIFVLTPKGDVKDLPKGATPVDFAYAVHTSLGRRAIGAKVNGKIVRLDYKLANGDVVEILISKDSQKGPNRDWLSFVATPLARAQIKKHFHK